MLFCSISRSSPKNQSEQEGAVKGGGEGEGGHAQEKQRLKDFCICSSFFVEWIRLCGHPGLFYGLVWLLGGSTELS